MTGRLAHKAQAGCRAAPAGIGKVTPLALRSSIKVERSSRRVSCRIIAQAGDENNVNAASQPQDANIGADAAPAVPLPPAYPPYPQYYQQPGPTPEAVYQTQMDPRYMQQQAADGRPSQQYYMAPPPGYYPYAPPPVQAESSSSGMPWFIWVGVGMAAAVIIGKVQEFQKNPKTPQQMMTEMMMKQAMGAMTGGKPGASPFAGMQNGMPPGFGAAAGGSPFGSAGSPFGAAGSPFGATAAAASTPAVDVPVQSSSAESADSKKGDKFSSRLNTEGRAAPAAAQKDGIDVVEPEVKEPTARSNSSTGSPKPGFFTDVGTGSSSSSSSSTAGAAAKAAASSANIFEQQQQQQQAKGGQQAGGDGAASENMMQMMETMLRNPEMQKMLYPYLPEPMRNPSSIQWMLENPEVKKQMATMFEQQNMMSPQMMEMMKGMDFNQEKVNAQFDELGLKPEDVISKVMSNPELASGFSNPKVQAAIIDISQNPMNIMKYQNDPEVMKVLEKVTEVFQPGVNPGAK